MFCVIASVREKEDLFSREVTGRKGRRGFVEAFAARTNPTYKQARIRVKRTQKETPVYCV